MKDLLDHLEYSKIFIIISVGMVALTYFAYIRYKEKKIAKFMPGIISILIGLLALITTKGRIIFLDDINNFAIFVIGTAVGLVGISIALIIGILNNGKAIKVKSFKKSEEAK